MNWTENFAPLVSAYKRDSTVNVYDVLFLQVILKEESYTSVHGMLDCAPRYTIECFPVITLHNYLPCSIKYKIKVGFHFLFHLNFVWNIFFCIFAGIKSSKKSCSARK